MDKNLYRRRYAAFAELLPNERNNLCHLTQEELAKKMGVTQEYISRIEAGHRRLDIIELAHYCHVTGINLSKFVVQLESVLYAYGISYYNQKEIKELKPYNPYTKG